MIIIIITILLLLLLLMIIIMVIIVILILIIINIIIIKNRNNKFAGLKLCDFLGAQGPDPVLVWVFIKGGCSRRGVQWMGVVS